MTRILAIETSCDETAAAVIADGRHILANVVATQIDLHRRYGGVFPEVASRQHVLSIQPVIEEALASAGVDDLRTLDAIAVTHGPGLAGSLLVGVNAAKGLSFTSGRPLVAINHLEGHVYSNWLETDDSGDDDSADDDSARGVPDDRFPVLVLIVSGGHTELVLMEGHGVYRHLGGTLDDAAGEAFDKVARLLNLGFPGGPAIQAAAESGRADAYALPRPLSHQPEHRFNFSFSGLKTAVLNLTRNLESTGVDPAAPPVVYNLAAAFQAAAVDVLVEKTAAAAAAYDVGQVCVCGGVSANRALRGAMATRMQELGLPLHIPPLYLCTDNAAMIGAAAHYRLRTAATPFAALDLDVFATLPLATA